MLSRVRSIISRASFRSLPWAVFFNPAFIARRGLWRCIRGFIEGLDLDGSGVWADVGCGSQPYEDAFDVALYVGLDVKGGPHPRYSKRADAIYDGCRFPIQSGYLDGVLCTQVIEHVESPQELLTEIKRVLKPHGVLIITAPFFWQEHGDPFDYRRYTSFGLRLLLESQGFRIIEYLKTTGSIEAIAQALSIYVSNNLILKLPGWEHAITALVCAPVQIIGMVLQGILPDSKNLFLDNAVIAERSK